MVIELRTDENGDKFPVFIDIPGREEYRLVATDGVTMALVFEQIPVVEEPSPVEGGAE